MEKIVADSCEMMLRDTKLPEIMAKEKPGLYKQIREWIANFAEKLRKAFTGTEARHEEARAMMQYAEEMQQIWDNALAGAVRNAEAASGNETVGENTRQSIREIGDTGKYYVKADRQVLFGNDPESWGEQLTRYINKEIRNGRDVLLTAADGEVIKLTATTAEKGAFRNLQYDSKGAARLLSDAEYEAKLNAEAHIDEIIETSEDKNKGRPNTPDENNLHGDMAKDGWRYRRAYFMDHDGKYYDLTLSVAYGRDGKVAYNIANMRERSFPTLPGSSNPKTGAQRGKASPKNTIPQTGEQSNPKFSMRDTAYTTAVESGNTEEAQRLVDEAAEEALENSEARLTDRGEFRMGAGELATVYHATYNDFTVFDRARLGENTDAYASDESTAATAHLGFWFNTQPLSQSASYAGGKDVKAYLNAENIYNAHSLEQLTGEIEQQWDEELTLEENAEAYVDGLKAQGYDGIVLRDEEFGGTSFVVFDPEQIKSAEVITYDDAGNVIPLSERFNSRSNDIRYSMRDVAEDDTADERRGRGAWIKILKHIF